MAGKLLSTMDLGTDGRTALIYYDTKAEVPNSGELTRADLGLKERLVMGSKVMTAKNEVGTLQSDDSWEWGDEE